MRRALFGLVVPLAITTACASGATTGAFTQTGRIEVELRRGTSTKMDVQRVLGTPKGTGGAVLPLDPRPREVWYYSDIAVTNIRGQGQRVLHGDTRLQFVLVFFRDGLFDGFMWSASAPVPFEAK
jgi:hypothetical protein